MWASSTSFIYQNNFLFYILKYVHQTTGIIMTENTENTEKNINKEILKTLQVTSDTNKSLVNLISAQHKQNKLKIIFWLIPIIFMIIFYAKQHLDKNSFYDKDKGYVAQVTLNGAIRNDSKSTSADAIIPALRNAFADTKAKGVILRISSPGGSPSQSILIHDELLRLQKVYPEKKFIISGEEGLASGGYWISTAANYINVLPSTLTGSIGVIMTNFDLSKLIARYDIKRRIITAGENKHRLDTFIEPRAEDIQKLKDVAEQLHKEFIKVVKTSRGNRLKGDPKELFSGDFWLGEEALKLGLVDSVSSTSDLLVKEFGTETIKDYSRKPGLFESLKPSNPLASLQSNINTLSELYNYLTYQQLPTIN